MWSRDIGTTRTTNRPPHFVIPIKHETLANHLSAMFFDEAIGSYDAFAPNDAY